MKNPECKYKGLHSKCNGFARHMISLSRRKILICDSCNEEFRWIEWAKSRLTNTKLKTSIGCPYVK